MLSFRGYMAPEYAMRGYLTDKADVYSFGVVALEIVSGKSNTNYRPKEEFVYLLDWVIYIYIFYSQNVVLHILHFLWPAMSITDWKMHGLDFVVVYLLFRYLSFARILAA